MDRFFFFFLRSDTVSSEIVLASGLRQRTKHSFTHVSLNSKEALPPKHIKGNRLLIGREGDVDWVSDKPGNLVENFWKIMKRWDYTEK